MPDLFDPTTQDAQLTDLVDHFAELREQVDRYAQYIRQYQNTGGGTTGFGGKATNESTGSSVQSNPVMTRGGISVPPVSSVQISSPVLTGNSNSCVVRFLEPQDNNFLIDHYEIYGQNILSGQSQEVMLASTHKSPAKIQFISDTSHGAIIVVQTVMKNGQRNSISDAPSVGITTLAAVTYPLSVSNGGTGLSTLTAHSLYVGNGTSPIVAVGVGSTNTVLHGITGADPVFSAVSLTADVTGTLPIANGGTGTTNGSITGSTALTFAAGGTAQNVTIVSSTTGKVILKPGTDSTAAIQAQNAAGTTVFNVDTTNKRFGVVQATPSATIEAQGPSGDPATSGTANNSSFRASNVAGAGVVDTGFGTVPQGWIQARDSGNLATNYALALNPNGGNVGVGTNNPTLPFEVDAGGGARLGVDSAGIKFFDNTTGGNVVVLGTNSPATNLSGPYTWWKMKSADGSTVYVPVWK